MATMTKAFAYLRVSGKGQIQGDGFPRQLTAIKGYAQAHEIRIVQVFREEGVCGATESADRPAWAQLMTALHSNGVKAVIIEELDRLARDLMVQEATIADLQKHGFTLIYVAEPDLMSERSDTDIDAPVAGCGRSIRQGASCAQIARGPTANEGCNGAL